MSNDASKPTSMLAIIALILSLTQLFPAIAALASKDIGAFVFMLILSAVAALLAIIALVRINRSKLGGEGMAVVALLLGGLGCFGSVMGAMTTAMGGIQPH